MLIELKENKYAYYDYSNIIDLLLYFDKLGLYKGEIVNVQKEMLQLVDSDTNIQEENPVPKSFDSEEDRQKYWEIYTPIVEKRKSRNRFLDKSEIEEENIYENADAFYKHCVKRKEYYCSHKSFMEYIVMDKLIDLINNSSLEELYVIRDAFNTVYYMSNAYEFYSNDIEELVELKYNLQEQSIVNANGITRRYALECLVSTIENVLERLGVEEDNE